MAVEKATSNIPFPTNPEEIELIIDDTPEDTADTTVMLEDGGAIINYQEPSQLGGEFDSNLAEEIPDSDLRQLASDLISSYQDDLESRQDWYDTYTDGLDLLGVKTDDREEPFRGASGVYHPLLAESATQFQSQAYKEMLPPAGPVSCRILGEATKEAEEQAKRVKDYMNHLILDVMEEYDSELDQMLYYLPLSGSTFKKTYYDQNLNRPVSKFVPADDLIVAYTESNLQTCPRFTHIVNMVRNDLRKLQVSGFYRDIDFENKASDNYNGDEPAQELTGFRPSVDNYDNIKLLEMHVDLDLEGYEDKGEDGEPTGIALPYIVTLHEDSLEVLSIRRNYLEGDINKTKRKYFTHYKFSPGLGFYGCGLIHMIGGLTKSATSILRQLIDAGTLANLPAGFKARGLRVRDEDLPLQPGEFRDVDAPGSSIREAIMPLPYKEPSPTLANLLGVLIDSGRRFAAVADNKIADTSQAMPVGTTVALLEQGTKILSAIHKRLHQAQRQELRILAEIIKESMPKEYPYRVAGYESTVLADDFNERVDVIPVSDPNMFSMSQRITMAQTQLQMAQTAPQLHDLSEAYRRMYSALGVQNIDDILPPKIEMVPTDPATENANSLMSKPLRAFQGQNHDAHVATHSAFIQDPSIQRNAQAVQLLTAHMQEHLSLKYRQQVEQIIGQPLPPEGQSVPPEVENMLSQATAQATAQISEMAKQMAQQGQFDPIVQLKQQELQIEAQDIQRKAAQDQSKAELERQKLAQQAQLKREELQQEEELTKEKIRSDEDLAVLKSRTTKRNT